MTHKQQLVVIGNGMAGARTVEEILARGGGQQFDITMFGDEPYGNYNRILLSNVLNGTQDAADIFLNPLEWYKENDVTLHAPARVTRIDRAAKIVLADNGLAVPYDKLLIATGSRPFVPPMEGLETPDGDPKHGVFVFRTLDDCHKIAGYATKCRKAAVIGGGLLGLEAARGLINYGAEVHVIHISGRLMSQQLDPQAAAILTASMEKLGIHVHLNKATVAVLGEENVTGLAFQDGTTLDCDMVVISTGIKPNVELAHDCGLSVERAIVVDNQMRSVDDPDVYVVGECAQHRGRVYGLVAPLWEMGQVLADHITGRNENAAYHGSKIATKLKVMGVELASMGVTEPQDERDEVVVYSEPKRGIYQKLILRDDVLLGAILLGDVEKSAFMIQAFDRAMPLDPDRRTLLFDLGSAKIGDENKLLAMPDDALVCKCAGVSKGQIRRCVEGGCGTLIQVQEATRGGMGCGSCKPLMQEIVAWVHEENGIVLPIASEAAPSTSVPPAFLAGLPLGKPEVAGAIKVLVREMIAWASSPD